MAIMSRARAFLQLRLVSLMTTLFAFAASVTFAAADSATSSTSQEEGTCPSTGETESAQKIAPYQAHPLYVFFNSFFINNTQVPSSEASINSNNMEFFWDLRAVCHCLFIIIMGWMVSRSKRFLIQQLAQIRNPQKLGRYGLLDNFLDVFVLAITTTFLYDATNLPLGPGMKSLFAAGGVGAFMFGLASRGLAEQVVGGLVVAAWDVFEEGDHIVLNKTGISGKVVRIRLADTAILQYDNILVKVPNSQIYTQHISNLSRVQLSPVGQSLRFAYEDLPKLPQLTRDIVQFLQKQCGEDWVVTDGSKPLRAHIYDYKPDHVQVNVKCHIRAQPNTSKYLDGRQAVLAAIADAVQHNGLHFALPLQIHAKQSQ